MTSSPASRSCAPRSTSRPRWIAENAGLEGRVAVNRARESGDERKTGLNAATGEYVDLVEAGVVDPVKVTRNAVRNAASIASMLLTTETLVADRPAEEEPPAVTATPTAATATAH